MSFGLSPQNERYLDEQVAAGLYPSKEAALNVAVDALRVQVESIPLIPEEHRSVVEAAIEDANQNGCEPMTAADWESLRRLARDVAKSR